MLISIFVKGDLTTIMKHPVTFMKLNYNMINISDNNLQMKQLLGGKNYGY